MNRKTTVGTHGSCVRDDAKVQNTHGPCVCDSIGSRFDMSDPSDESDQHTTTSSSSNGRTKPITMPLTGRTSRASLHGVKHYNCNIQHQVVGTHGPCVRNNAK